MSSTSFSRRRFIQSMMLGGTAMASPFHSFAGNPQGNLTALVIEEPSLNQMWSSVSGDRISRINNQTGAAIMLAEAGFNVGRVNLGTPFKDQKTDLLFLGSYTTMNDSVVQYLEQNGESIQNFVEKGGVVVQLVEPPPADQFNRGEWPKKLTGPFILPSHLQAERTRETFWHLHVRTPDHPLLKDMPIDGVQPGSQTLSDQYGHNATWMSIGERKGFNVLLSNTDNDSRTAMVEGAHGKGRYILSSIFLDKLFDEDGNPTRSEPFMATAKVFYQNLQQYTMSLNRPDRAPVIIGGTYEDPVPAAFMQDAFTLVLIPDTQVYSLNHVNNQHFQNIVDWIIENRDTYNIRYALHLGDVVNNGGQEMQQWEFAAPIIHKLDGILPYSISLGNHDYTDNRSESRETPLNDYFHPSKYEHWPTFGGCFESGHLENTYHTFQVNNNKFLILALEFGPRDIVLEWANDIVSKHSDHRAILTTHAYMYTDDHRYNHAERGDMQSWNPHTYGSEGGNNDGKEIWDKLVSRHPNFFLVANGHVINDGLGRKSTATPFGNTVHQMLYNYQGFHEGGMGSLRLLHFHPDDKTIQVRTFLSSPRRFLTGPQNQFQLIMNNSL